jgi:hypothetical protein
MLLQYDTPPWYTLIAGVYSVDEDSTAAYLSVFNFNVCSVVVAAQQPLVAPRQPIFGVREMGVCITIAESPKKIQIFEFYIVCFI